MNNRINIALIIGLLLGCCSCNPGFKTNDYLGDYPAMALEWEKEMKAKKDDIKKETNFEKVFKLEKEKELINDKWSDQIDEYLKTYEFKSIPLEIADNIGYEVLSLELDQVYPKSFSLAVKVKGTTDPVEEPNNWFKKYKDTPIYAIVVDSENKLIDQVRFLPNEYIREGSKMHVNAGYMKKGKEYFDKQTIYSPEDYVNVAKIKFVDEQTYKNLSSINR